MEGCMMGGVVRVKSIYESGYMEGSAGEGCGVLCMDME